MSFCVVIGNSFSIKEELKQKYGFKFDWDSKVWFKPVLTDKFEVWKKVVEAYSKEVEACWVSDLSEVPKLLKAIKELEGPKEAQPHELDNSVFELKKWFSGKLKEQLGLSHMFFNIKILRVHASTPNALLVDFEFFSGVGKRCGICGKLLSNDISRACGIGPICAERLGMNRPTMETAKEIMKALDEKLKLVGSVNKVWIPKSQVKEILKPEEVISA